jgi:uncharacterized membrane protein
MTQSSAEANNGSLFYAGRLAALSDGIFAVALTLLILDIKPPETDAAHLARTLVTTIPSFGIFALSFAIVSYHWVVHHLIFRLLKAVNRWLIWLNLVFLFTIVVLPFSAAVLGRYPSAPPALVLYGTNIAFCSAALTLVWWYMLGANLTTNMLPALQHYISICFLIWFALSIIGIGLAPFLPIGSLTIFVALPVLYAFSSRPPK